MLQLISKAELIGYIPELIEEYRERGLDEVQPLQPLEGTVEACRGLPGIFDTSIFSTAP